MTIAKGALDDIMYNRNRPELVYILDVPHWRWEGKAYPIIAGGDGTGGEGSGDGAGGTPQGGATAQGATTTPGDAEGEAPAGKAADTESFDPERARATIAEIRASEKALKAKVAALTKEHTEAATKLKAIEDGEKSELDKANERAAKAEAERAEALSTLQDKMLRYAVLMEAQKQNVIDPDMAFLALDRTKIENDEDGEPKNVADLIKELVKAKPYLVKATQTTGVPETPRADGTTGINDATAKDARERMARQYAQSY